MFELVLYCTFIHEKVTNATVVYIHIELISRLIRLEPYGI